MFPILFEIPGLDFKVRSFGVMLALAFLVGMQVAVWLFRKYGDKPETDPLRFPQVAIAILIGIVVGARAVYVIVEIFRYLAAENGQGMVGQEFLEYPWTMLFVWKGGLVMYGGLIGGVLFGLRSGVKHEMSPIAGLDIGLTAGFLGLAIGRIGCYLVGDDYGSVVPEAWQHLPWPIVLTVPSVEWLQANPDSLYPDNLAEKTLWATQAWMHVNAWCIFFFGLWMLRRRRYPGHTTLWLLLVYAITRFVIEIFRGDEIRGVWFGAVSTSQLISIAGAAFAIVLLWRNRGRRVPMPGVKGPAAAVPPTASP